MSSRRAAAQLLVIAKAPVPGRVKTRLCPPYTHAQAARLAAAALADTLAAVRSARAARRVVALDGAPDGLDLTGCHVVPQRGDGLGPRLANAFRDAMAGPDHHRPTLVIGMDTPQVSAALLDDALDALATHGTVFGTAADGGWWALGISDPEVATVLPAVPMSRPDTGARTAAALSGRGVRWAALPELVDVDTVDSARAVARAAPGTRFAAALRALPTPVSAP